MTANSELESIFQRALECEGTEQRDSYLQEACGDDRSLRAEIDRLLRSHEIVAGSHVDSPNLRATELINRGTRNESVLGNFHDLLGDSPSVVLRGLDAEPEPIQRPASEEMPPAPQDGRYQLQGEIARGGMGVVIKGRDNDLGRDLAVKVLLESHRDKPDVTQRFIEEAQIGGQLQHPGIAPVYELGQFADQRPYFTMKLVKGKTLAAMLSARQSPEENRGKFVGIFEQVCQTMAYAHSRGVIHRDLKPANIMVGAFGEVQVMDWGLAKVLSSGGVTDEKIAHQTHQDRSVIETLRSSGSDTPMEFGSQTQMGSVMGTPAYMPPEQALGEIDQLDQRADVFGLGAILCEILTGKPPYVAEDPLKVYRLATRGKLDDCYERLDACDADAELVKITRTCLSAEPSARPCDAGVLASRLSNHIAEVDSRLRQTEIDRAAQTARVEEERKRRRVSMALAASVLTLVIALSSGGLWLQAKEAEAANQLAGEERERAQIERDANEQLRWVLYRSDIERAQTEVQRGNYDAAKRILLAHAPKEGQRDLRGFEWHYLYRRCPVGVRDPNFQWHDDILQVLREDTLQVPRNIQLPPEESKRYTEWSVSHNENRIAVIDNKSKSIIVFDAQTGRRHWSTAVEQPLHNPVLTLNREGTLVGLSTVGLGDRAGGNEASGIDASSEILIWDVDDNQQLSQITGRELGPLSDHGANIAFRPGSTSVLICSRRTDGPASLAHQQTSAFMWDCAKNELKFRLLLERENTSGTVAFSSDGAMLAIPSESFNSGKGTDQNTKSLPDESGVVQLYDAESGHHVRNLVTPPFKFSVQCTFSPDGARLVMPAANGSQSPDRQSPKEDALLIWDVASGNLIQSSPSRAGRSTAIFSRDGHYVLLKPNHGKNLEVFRVSDGWLVLQVEDPHEGITGFSSDNRSIQTIDIRGKLWRWKIPRSPFESDKYVKFGGTSLSGDGKRISRRRWFHPAPTVPVSVFDLTGEKLHSAVVPNHWKGKLNHDGSKYVTVTWDRDSDFGIHMSLWDLEIGRRTNTVFESNEPEAIRWWRTSPNDSKLAAIIHNTLDGKVQARLQLWDTDSLELKFVELTTQEQILEFSPDGKKIAVATSSVQPQFSKSAEQQDQSKGILTLYDVATLKPIREIAIARPFKEFRFGPQDRMLVGLHESHDEGDRIEIWDLDTEQLKTTIRSPANDVAFSPSGKRLITMNRVDLSVANRRSAIFTIWDVETGDRLLRRTYYASGNLGWQGFRFLPGEHRLIGLGELGTPQIWDGTPVEITPKMLAKFAGIRN